MVTHISLKCFGVHIEKITFIKLKTVPAHNKKTRNFNQKIKIKKNELKKPAVKK
jgi:hypothetical protein